MMAQPQNETRNTVPSSPPFVDQRFRSRFSTVIERIGGVKKSAEIAQVTDEQVGKWRDGKNKAPFFALSALCKAAGVSLDWLAGETDEQSPAQSEALPNLTLIPRLDVEAAAGYGALAESEEPVALLAFNSDWLRRRGINPGFAHALTAKGDSMEPTIRSGDVLLVDTSIDKIEDNGIYIVRIGGLLLLKRVHVKMSGGLTLISDNKDLYPPDNISQEEAVDVFVAGRVMWFGRSL